MPRAIWTGAISFGLVNVPVGLYSATESRTIHLHQVQKGTNRRIRNERVAEGTGREVDFDTIVKGYETDDGDLVIVTPEELGSVEPTRTRTVEIEDFVELGDIDPIYFDEAYHLAPADEAKKPYALLRDAMEAAIRTVDRALVLHTMHFGDEVRTTDELDVPGTVTLTDEERKIAGQLIDSLTTDFDPMAYEDRDRQRVADLVKQKAEGGDVVIEQEEEPEHPSDLMTALEASLGDIEEARTARRRRRELAGLSKAELQKRAGRAGVEGRSSMSKDELIAALVEAS